MQYQNRIHFLELRDERSQIFMRVAQLALQIMWLPTPPCASWSSTSSWSFNSSSSFRLCSYTSDLWPTNYKKEKCYSFHDLWVVNKDTQGVFWNGRPLNMSPECRPPFPYILYFCNSCSYTKDLDVFQSWGRGSLGVLTFLFKISYLVANTLHIQAATS